MRIKNASIVKNNIELTKPFSYFLATLKYLPYAMIKIDTDNGIMGYGEASFGWDTTGEMQDGGMEIFNSIIKPILKNKKIGSMVDVKNVLVEVNKYIYGNTALKAGLEFALLDALGKFKNKPVYALFSGIKKDYIVPQKVFSFEENNFEKLKREIDGLKKQGVLHFKFKAGGNIDYLVEIFNKFSKIDSEYSFIIDVNQGWENSEKAVGMIKKLEKFNIAWIEQPIYHADFEGMAEIRRQTKIPIMADESCHDILDLENLYLRKSIDMINIKLTKCGGIIEAKKMIDFCDKHGLKYMLGDMLQSSLGTAANLHTATLGNFISYDLTLPERIKGDKFRGIVFDGFKAYIPNKPGLGVEKKVK
jgi:L-alanine-DL-glutamate epimerase-like enolase superfamily enzyme